MAGILPHPRVRPKTERSRSLPVRGIDASFSRSAEADNDPSQNKNDFRKAGSIEDPFNWSQLPPDEEGAELSKEARIWKVYVGETDKWDAEKVDGWNKALDVLLVFVSTSDQYASCTIALIGSTTRAQAALFSAISTSFLIESSGMLKQDPNDVSAAALVAISQLLAAITTNSSANPEFMTPNQINTTSEAFVPPQVAVVVNTLWFLSLALSISASFLAMLAKDWCHSFIAHKTGHPRDQAYRRQRKWTMIEQWKMEEFILMLPSLIHLSLVLFAAGLCIYLWDLNSVVAVPVICVCGAALSFYALSSIAATFIAHFPYTTIFSRVFCSAFVQKCYTSMASMAHSVRYYAFLYIIRWPLRLFLTVLVALVELLLFPVVLWDMSGHWYLFIDREDLYMTPWMLGATLEINVSSGTISVLSRYWSNVCSGMKKFVGEKRFELNNHNITSLALSWLLQYCETPKSVSLTLQAIAGATQSIPNKPLVTNGATWQILQQLVSRSGHHTKSDTSLYSRALGFLQTQPTLSSSDEVKAVNPSDSRVLIWELQEHQESQIGVFLKHREFLPTKENLHAMAVGNNAIILSLQLLKEDNRNGKRFFESIKLFRSIVDILTSHVQSGHQQLHLISLYSLLNAVVVLASISQVPKVATSLPSLCIECLLDIDRFTHSLPELEDRQLASPAGMAIATIDQGTNAALILCALLCMPSRENSTRTWSLMQANTCLNQVLRVLVVKDPSGLRRQAMLRRAGFYQVLSIFISHSPYQGPGNPDELLIWCHQTFAFFLRRPRIIHLNSHALRFQEKISGFSGAIDNLHQVMRSLDSGDQTGGWLPWPIHPMLLAISCYTQSSEQRATYESLLPRSRFPTQTQCFELLVRRSTSDGGQESFYYQDPPLLTLRNIFESQKLNPYFRHLAATQLWFFFHYYQLSSQHSGQSTLLESWYSSETEAFTRLISGNFAETLETFILGSPDQGGNLGTYSYRVIECILQARMRRLGEQFSAGDRELLTKVEHQLQDDPPRFRGLGSLSSPPTATHTEGVEIPPTEILPRELPLVAPHVPTVQPTGEIPQLAEDPQEEVGHVALEFQPIGPPSAPVTNCDNTSSGVAPTAGVVSSEQPDAVSQSPANDHSTG